jgi:hypothetical protein
VAYLVLVIASSDELVAASFAYHSFERVYPCFLAFNAVVGDMFHHFTFPFTLAYRHFACCSLDYLAFAYLIFKLK